MARRRQIWLAAGHGGHVALAWGRRRPIQGLQGRSGPSPERALAIRYGHGGGHGDSGGHDGPRVSPLALLLDRVRVLRIGGKFGDFSCS